MYSKYDQNEARMYSECVRDSSEVNRMLLGIGKIYSELNRIYSEKSQHEVRSSKVT